jgi:hypothetical protein
LGLGVRSGGWFESSWAETSREWTCKLRQLISQTTLRTPRINDHPWFRAVVSYRRSCQSKPTQTIKLSTVLIDPDFICSVEQRDPYRPLQVRSTIDEYRGAAGARRQTPDDPALAVLQPIGSSLLGPTHRIDAVSGSHGSLHSVSPASALNHRPIHY